MANQLFYCIVVLTLCLPIRSMSQTDALQLHDIVGDVIDAHENEQYHFFGTISGFTAARLMPRGSRTLSFYMIRNFAARAQFFIFSMNEIPIEEIRARIAQRINLVQKDSSQFEQALFPVTESQWQEKSRNKKVTLRDGNQLLGTFSRAQSDTLTVMTHSGLAIPVPISLIANVSEEMSHVKGGKFYRSDPHDTRLLFAPTGRRLKAGRGYFADYYIFFPTLAFGLTEFFSIAGGMSIIPGVPLADQLYYFMPKVTIKASENVGIGGGLLYLPLPDDDESVSLAYGVTSFGKQEGALTLGLGVPMGNGSSNSPVFLLGGDVQVSNGAKLITENWIFTGEESVALLSGGVRFFGDRIAVDLAFLTSPEFFGEGGFPFLPWVDFAVVFGK